MSLHEVKEDSLTTLRCVAVIFLMVVGQTIADVGSILDEMQ